MSPETSRLLRLGAAYWGLMLLVSIANGGLRDVTYGPQLPERLAHQISTLTAPCCLASSSAISVGARRSCAAPGH